MLTTWTPRCAEQVIIASQMATKLLTNENKPAATFETGEKAILMPQLGGSSLPRPRLVIIPLNAARLMPSWVSSALLVCR